MYACSSRQSATSSTTSMIGFAGSPGTDVEPACSSSDDRVAERRPHARLLALVQARPCRVVICDLDRPVERLAVRPRRPRASRSRKLRRQSGRAPGSSATTMPTTSPRELSTAPVPSSTPRNGASAALERARVAVLGLQREARAVRRDCAEQALGAAFRHPTGPFGHEGVSSEPSPPTSSGRARIAASTRSAPSSCGKPANAAAMRSSGHPEGDDATAVDGRRHLVGGKSRDRATSASSSPCSGWSASR